MKKLLFILVFFVSLKSFGQGSPFPATTTNQGNVPIITGSPGTTVLFNDNTWKSPTVSSIQIFRPQDYNSKAGDGIEVLPNATTAAATTTASSVNVSCPACNFLSGDVGKIVLLDSAGTAKADFVDSIATVVDATHITLHDAAVSSATNQRIVYGTDATSAIQQAINACYNYSATLNVFAKRGGEVYVQVGLYILNGPLITSVNGGNPNSQLYIPAADSSRDPRRTQLTIFAEALPNFIANDAINNVPFWPTKNATVLLSTIVGSGSAPSILGTQGPSTSFQHFNYSNLEIYNLTFLARMNPTGSGPTVGGVNMNNMQTFSVRSCLYSIDGSVWYEPEPTNDVAGFIMPKNGCELINHAQNIMAVGVRYGTVTCEHNEMNEVNCTGCKFGIVFANNDHPNYASRTECDYCYADYYVPNSTILGISTNSGSPSKFYITEADNEMVTATGNWYDHQYFFVDSGSLGHGTIGWHVDLGGGGSRPDLFTKYGASNVIFFPILNPYQTPIRWNSLLTGTSVLLDSLGMYTDSTRQPYGFKTYGSNATSGGSAGYYAQATATGAQAQIQLENDRGSHASYGELLYGGSANSQGNLFGVSRADKEFLVADGASNLGLYVGNLQSQPLVLGTNNTARMTFAGNGDITIAGSASNNIISITGTNATRSTIYLQATNSASQGTLYIDNDRGSLAAYGGLLTGGSTNSGTLFGSSRADRTVLFNDGASSKGLALGTLTAQPLIFGTNNAEDARFLSNGHFLIGTTATDNGALTVAGVAAPEANVTRDLGTSSFAWRDLYFSHTISESAMGSSTSTGTNVTSATPSGSDESFQITLVTSGAVAGTLADLSFGRTWIGRPHCVISSANTTTGSAIAVTVGGYIAANATSTSNFEMAGAITAAGTYVFNCNCGQ